MYCTRAAVATYSRNHVGHGHSLQLRDGHGQWVADSVAECQQHGDAQPQPNGDSERVALPPIVLVCGLARGVIAALHFSDILLSMIRIDSCKSLSERSRGATFLYMMVFVVMMELSYDFLRPAWLCALLMQ